MKPPLCDLLIGSLGTLGSTNLSFFSDSLSFSFILSASLFMDVIFFLLNPALVLLDALVILSSKAPVWDFRLLISPSRLTNFLASLESLCHLCLSCLFVKGASNSVEWGTKDLRLSDFGLWFPLWFPSRHSWSGHWGQSPRPLWGWWSSLGLMFVILEKGY